MRVLGVFAKYWQPGMVKTRLAAAIGESVAAQLHRAFLRCTLDRTVDLAERNALVYSPANRRNQFAELAENRWELVPQQSGDLGQRMHGFFASELSEDSKSVVVIGSDSPNLPRELLEEAFEALQRVPVVLGPSTDGGYYLIGLRGAIPPIFSNIAWGTPAVWQQTIELLHQQDIAIHALAPWYDVDLIQDLQRLNSDLRALANPSPAEAQLVDQLDRIGRL